MEAELARAEGAELPEHDVFAQAAHAVALGKRRRLHEDVHRLLERAAHQGSRLHAVDAVPGDGHEVPAVRHHLDQDGEVAVVDVGAVELDDAAEFLQQRVAHRLDAENLNHLDEVVRRRPGEVHVLVVHHLEQVHALRVQLPLGRLRERLRLRVQAHDVRLADEHLADVRDPAQAQVRQELRLEALQKHLVLRRHLPDVPLLELVVHDPDPQEQLLGVVVVEDAAQVVLEVLVDALRDVRHEELLVHHHLAVQLDPQQPRAHPARVHLLVGHLVVAPHELAVLLDHRVRHLGVVVHLGHRRDAVKRRVLEARLDVLRRRAVAREVLPQRHGEARRLDLLGDVDDLLQTRHAQGDVLRRDAGEVEGVERHLRRGLADALRGDRADAVPGRRERHLEPRLHLADDPVERRRAELELLHHALGAQRRPDEREEQDGRVPLRLQAQRVRTRDDDQGVEQRAHRLDHVHRLELVARRTHAGGDVLHQPVVLLRVPDDALQVHGQVHRGVAGAHHLPQLLAVGAHLLPLQVQQSSLVHRVGEVVRLRLRHPPATEPGLVRVDEERLPELLAAVPQRVELLRLDVRRVHAVLAVQELNHVPRGVPHRAVVLDDDVLHRLHQTPLDVPRLGRLHRGVDETLAAAHGVEEELLRRQPAKVRVLHEPARLGAQIVLGEVRQRARVEPERDALPLDVLLPDARNHLRDVQERPLRARLHRHLDVVGVVQTRLRRVPRVVARLVQNLVHLLLERLVRRHPRLRVELVALVLVNHLPDVRLRLGDRVVDAVHRRVIRDGVADPDGEPVVQEPVVQEPLHLRHEPARRGGAPLLPDDVDQSAAAAPHRLFAQDARDELAALDAHARVLDAEVAVVVVLGPSARAEKAHVRDEHREHLLPRPQGLGLEDGRFRHLAVPILEPHQDVHEDVLGDERVALGHQAARQQRVLHDRHHGLVRLRGDDHLRHHHELLHLRARLHRLREVHVHLVPVEIGVVRRRHGDVHPERGVRHDAHAVAHDGHLVQGGLAVEQHAVAVDHVPLHPVPVLQPLFALLLQEPQVHALPVLADDVLRPRLARGRVRSVLHELLQSLDVVRGHRLGVRHVERDAPRHAELVQHQVGVGGDDRARGEVHALSHQVSADAPVLPLEALRDALDRPPASRQRPGHPRHGVIHERHDVVLQQLRELPDDVLRRAVLFLPLEVFVRAHNLHELHRQVILRSRGRVERHRGSHGVRRHGHDAQDEPRGMRVPGVEAQDLAVLVGDVLEDRQRLLRGDDLLALAALGEVIILPALLELRRDLHAFQPVLRLGGSAARTHRARLARVRELAQALLGVLHPHELREPRILILRRFSIPIQGGKHAGWGARE